MNVTILFGGECPLPPESIGAVEILWYNVGHVLAGMGHCITLIGKGNPTLSRNRHNFICKVVPGFIPSRFRIVTLIRALANSFRLLRLVTPCDILVVNNAWAMLLMRVFGWKRAQKVVINIQRMPKGFFWLRHKGADSFVCPSSTVAKRVSQMIPVCMSSRVEVVPNPVDLRHFNLKHDLEVGNSGATTIAYHGRIHREKGLHLLAEAVRGIVDSHPDIRLKLIGPVEESRGGSGFAYKSELTKILGNRIEWVAPISDREQLAKELASADIYCYPSVAENGETFGVAPLEAMSLGLPVVVSALDCFADFVKNGENGLVFNHTAADPVAALHSCLRMMLDDSSLRRRLAATAASDALSYSTEIVAKMYEDLFFNILAESEKGRNGETNSHALT